MIKILYSIYTDGFPNQFAGGPNNIIYKIIENIKHPGFNFDYLSRDIFVENISINVLNNLSSALSLKTKTTNFLFNNSLIYKKIVSSDVYLPFHLKKKERAFNKIRKKINQYDIIHSQDSISLPLISPKGINSKKIITVHSNGPLSSEIINSIRNTTLKSIIKKKLHELEKTALKSADIITFPSQSAKKIFFSDLNIDERNYNYKIIYNGINYENVNHIKKDKEVFSKYGVKRNYDLVLLNISTYREERQLDKLFSIVKILNDKLRKNIFLINIGSGQKCKPLQNLVKEIGVENNVKLLGRLPNEDVIKFLKTTDIFIMTTKRVIFDISLLEALASGACCVVSNDGGNKEIIKDGVNGYFINPDNIEESAKKIVSIDINIVKENAIKTAQQFSAQKMVDEYFNVYEELLHGV